MTTPEPLQGKSGPFYITSNLSQYERKVSSQFGEDGVIAQVAKDLDLETGSFFEFGIGPADGVSYHLGLEGNFVQLRAAGWHGVFLDGTPHMPDGAGIEREYITALNINELYRKHGLPDDLDFMSIDVDAQDFWIWMALDKTPKVMVIEYNGGLGPDVSVTTQFDVTHMWDGTIYQGASLRALEKLAVGKGYLLVWTNGVNAMFVRRDLVANPQDFLFEALWRSYPPHLPDPHNRPWVTV